MRIERFKQLFCVSADEYSKYHGGICENFVFQGSQNWDFYFEKQPICKDLDVIKNVKLITFGNQEDFEKFLDENKIIDYSLEHRFEGDYLVLVDSV